MPTQIQPVVVYALGTLLVAVLVAAWTYFLLTRQLKSERDAFVCMREACDTGADLNKRMGQIISQLGNLAASKPFVEVPQAHPPSAVLSPFSFSEPTVTGNPGPQWTSTNGHPARIPIEETETEQAGGM